jgi:hypothetical protein
MKESSDVKLVDDVKDYTPDPQYKRRINRLWST